MGTFLIDPDATIDYSIDWLTDGYLDTGETITASSWTISPTGATKNSDSKTTSVTTITVSGMTHGRRYRLKNNIVTSNSRTDERSIHILCWEPR